MYMYISTCAWTIKLCIECLLYFRADTSSDTSREVAEDSKKVSERRREKENKEPATNNDEPRGSATDVTTEQPIVQERPTHRVSREREGGVCYDGIIHSPAPGGTPERDCHTHLPIKQLLKRIFSRRRAQAVNCCHMTDLLQLKERGVGGASKEEEGVVEDMTTPLTNGPHSPSPPTIRSGLV